MKSTLMEFRSVQSMLSWIDKNKRVAGDKSTSTESPEWFGSADYAGAVEIALNGWQEGATRIAQGMKKASAPKRGKALTMKRVRKYDVSGEECDVARYLSGDPENMSEDCKVKAKGKTLSIINVSCAFSGGCPESAIENYAVAMACAIQKIEATGKRVELWATKTCKAPCGDTFTLRVKIKDAASRIQPASLAIACHPVFQRRFAFAVLERQANAKKFTSANYGTPCNPAVAMTGEFLTTAKFFHYTREIETAIIELQTK